MSAASAFYLRTYTRQRIFVEPGGTGKSGVWNRMLVFDIYGASVIIYLTRQPVREVKAPRPGELTVYKVSRPILPRFRAAYLFFRFSMRALPAARINTLFALQDITGR